MNRLRLRMLAVPAAILAAATAATVHADTADEGWNEAKQVGEVNSALADGCPIESPNGRQLFLASMRQGTFGSNDIWVAHRATRRLKRHTANPQTVGGPVPPRFGDVQGARLGEQVANWVADNYFQPAP